MRKSKYYSFMILLLTLLAPISCHKTINADRPNILLVFSDQQHWQAMGFMDSFFNTPHLDDFAKVSTVFENSFCTTPQCSPSRSSLMTGFYPGKTKVLGNIGAAGGNPLAQETIAPELQSAGYHTAYFGKWHLGNKDVAVKGWNQKMFKRNDSLTVSNAVNFLKERGTSTEPFALYVSFVNPHDIYHFQKHELKSNIDNIPLSISWEKETFTNKPELQKEFMLLDQGKIMEGMSKSGWQRYRDYYRSKTKLYDDKVGRILDELKRQRLWDNTIIIITSDHGDMDTNHKLIFKGPFMYENLIRIPLLIRVPEKFGGRYPRQIKNIDVVNVDIVPTIRDFCGIPARASDGISLMPLLTGSKEYKGRDFVIGQYYGKQRWVSPIRMIRTSGFKYNKYIGYKNELYDLNKDPFELLNIADDPQYLEIWQEFSGKLDEWIKENNDPFYFQKATDRSGKEK